MSILFGMRKTGRGGITEQELRQLATLTEQYAPDGSFLHVNGSIGMGFQPYHTHPRSRLEAQPAAGRQGNILTFDGRLDNHSELRTRLDLHELDISDSEIVLAAFERWGEECFRQFVGDWALALWSDRDQALYLARDHAGTRTLYFEASHGNVVWSTWIDTLLRQDRVRETDEIYTAGYLLSQTTHDRTPYNGITAVPPAHYVVFKDCRVSQKSHWQWMSDKAICYKTDKEYEEHFTVLLRTSIERRTQPGFSILAELSGGMDSSSIVCMSDHIQRRNGLEAAQMLDTVSYFDDAESHWNERPYVAVIESHRKKTGTHVTQTFSEYLFHPITHDGPHYPVPGTDRAFWEREQMFENLFNGRDFRVILSGLGGDEVLGGIPTPLPELADYLVRGHITQFLGKTVAWSVPNQTPALHLLAQTAEFALDTYTRPDTSFPIPPWVTTRAFETCRDHKVSSWQRRFELRMPPSRHNSALAWASVTDTLARRVPPRLARREYRYPYLDKDLVEFLFRIPPSQLVRPGRRRALMRSSLKGIVPEEILERKHKAVLVRRPLIALQQAHDEIAALFSESVLADMRFIDTNKFLDIVGSAYTGTDLRWIASIARTIYLELWLQSYKRRRMNGSDIPTRECPLPA